MSRENVEVVRNGFLTSDWVAASHSWHPQIEWVIAREHPDARTLSGYEAIWTYFREWEQTLDDLRVEIDEVVDAGERAVAVGMVRGTGIESGADMEVPIAFLCSLREGKVTRVEEFLDPSEALKAVGLEE